MTDQRRTGNLRKLIWNCRFLDDKKRIEWYPNFWLMRVKVIELAPDWRTVRIKLPHTWLSTNPSGGLFGGFQACLADPIAAMVSLKLFPEYSVWTRSLQLDFRRETLTATELRFSITPEDELRIQQELDAKGRSTPSFEYGFYQEDGSLCTGITATVALRSKDYKKQGIRILK
jgi:acyl-coenzyme A thioesterase PaaI-like protein